MHHKASFSVFFLVLSCLIPFSKILAVTPFPTPTESSTSAASPVSTGTCTSLTILSGNNSVVPASVSFRAQGIDSVGPVSGYRFYFGDGTNEETTISDITHKYEVSGSFFVKAEVKDSTGVWKSSSQCETKVTVLGSSVESQKSTCSDLFITDGNYQQAPATALLILSGYDNKGDIKRYKVDYGDGTSEERQDMRFEKLYSNAGTYIVRGYVLDSQDSWKGGSGSCQKTFYANTYPLTEQPSTGTPTAFTLLALTGGLWSFALFAIKRFVIS